MHRRPDRLIEEIHYCMLKKLLLTGTFTHLGFQAVPTPSGGCRPTICCTSVFTRIEVSFFFPFYFPWGAWGPRQYVQLSALCIVEMGICPRALPLTSTCLFDVIFKIQNYPSCVRPERSHCLQIVSRVERLTRDQFKIGLLTCLFFPSSITAPRLLPHSACLLLCSLFSSSARSPACGRIF